jgi:LEA14-like dessication related protein
MNKGLIAVGIAFVLFAGKKAFASSKLKFYPKGIKLTGSGLVNQKLFLVAEVVNPTFTQLTVNNVFLTVYEGSTLIGRVEYNTPIVIGGNGSTILNIPLIPSYGAITYLAYELIAKGKQPKFTITGSINSMGVMIPIEYKLDLI